MDDLIPNISLVINQFSGKRDIKTVGNFTIWILKEKKFSSRANKEVKVKILSLVLNVFQDLYLKYSEDPMKNGVNGKWKCINDQVWKVPADIDIIDLFNWLYLGNWLLYVNEAGEISRTNKLFRFNEPITFTALMEESDIVFIIASFHDNDPWIIVVNEYLKGNFKTYKFRQKI